MLVLHHPTYPRGRISGKAYTSYRRVLLNNGNKIRYVLSRAYNHEDLPVDYAT